MNNEKLEIKDHKVYKEKKEQMVIKDLQEIKDHKVNKVKLEIKDHKV